VRDNKAGGTALAKPKADPRLEGHVGAPMPGLVLNVRVEVGQPVVVGDALVVLSAMKMETLVTAPVNGVVKAIHVMPNDQLGAGDLVVEIDTVN